VSCLRAISLMDISAISSVPGVIQTVIADDSGRLLEFAGDMDPPTAAVLVLGHATISAAAELGRRSGVGDCHEVIQRHEGGWVYLHSLSHRRVLMVRYTADASINAIRDGIHNMPALEESLQPRQDHFDITSALHAEPLW